MSSLFEKRKREHISLSLSEDSLALEKSGLHRISLIHEALPDLDFQAVSLQQTSLGLNLKTPFYVSSMTGGWQGAESLNLLLAQACERRGWAMGVGSQRRQLMEISQDKECQNIRKACPRLILFGNIGLSQVIATPPKEIQRLADTLEAQAMIVHLNPLQEVIQKEGTPQFKGGLKALERLLKELSLPLIVKETGCGFYKHTLDRLTGLGLAAVDISGMGGTHWGRIEGKRFSKEESFHGIGETFSKWGISTLESLLYAKEKERDYELWASGGMETGLDGAKALALGASCVGFGRSMLKAATEGEEVLDRTMARIEQELKISLFCTGSATIEDLQRGKKWKLNL